MKDVKSKTKPKKKRSPAKKRVIKHVVEKVIEKADPASRAKPKQIDGPTDAEITKQVALAALHAVKRLAAKFGQATVREVFGEDD